MKYLPLLLILVCSLVLAEPVVDKDGKEWTKPDKLKDYKTYTKEKFTTKLNTDGYYEKVAKPDIVESKLLTEQESKDVKLALWNEGLVDEKNKVFKEGRKLIFKQANPAKNDYKHDFDRGTIHFTTELRNDGTPRLRNYSFHKVIIPDGTVIKECNFLQRKPHTQAIQGDNLHFISCNLKNVEINPTWIVEDCLTYHEDRQLKKQTDIGDGITEIEIECKIDKEGVWVDNGIDKATFSNDKLVNSLLIFSE